MDQPLKTSTTTPMQCGPPILETAIVAATVHVSGYMYLVDMGRSVRPQLHVVYKDRTCNCRQPDCPAVQVVAEWLKAGRIERAPDPPAGYSPYAPLSCPVCSAGVVVDHSLSSRARGVGWQCLSSGSLHYWQDKVNALRAKAHGRVWLFPPVVDEAGRTLYPGVRLDEVPCGLPMGYMPEANH